MFLFIMYSKVSVPTLHRQQYRCQKHASIYTPLQIILKSHERERREDNFFLSYRNENYYLYSGINNLLNIITGVYKPLKIQTNLKDS